MTAEELREFAEAVRAECDERLAMLRAVDPEMLPADLRTQHRDAMKSWGDLRLLTETDAMALHEAACAHAGRELTPEEVRALLVPQ